VHQIITVIRQLGVDLELTKDNERLLDLSVAMVDLSRRWGILTEYTFFFGDGTVDLARCGDLLYFGWTDLYNRAVRSRKGMPQDIALWEGDKLTVVHMPRPVRIPDCSSTSSPNQTTTPRRR